MSWCGQDGFFKFFSFGAAESIQVAADKKPAGLWACEVSLKLSLRPPVKRGGLVAAHGLFLLGRWPFHMAHLFIFFV